MANTNDYADTVEERAKWLALISVVGLLLLVAVSASQSKKERDAKQRVFQTALQTCQAVITNSTDCLQFASEYVEWHYGPRPTAKTDKEHLQEAQDRWNAFCQTRTDC